MLPFLLVVVGGSSGSIQPLIHLAKSLPAEFYATICMVIHISAHDPSYFPEILGRAGPLPATQAQHLERVESGHVYCAPPGHHVLVENGHFRTTTGPKENGVCPAIDILFRSAVQEEGSNVIGVVLLGLLDDGASGLWAIRDAGGITVVQDPNAAEYDSMPRSALDHVDVDYTVRGQDLASLLIELVSESAQWRLEVEATIKARGLLDPLTWPSERGQRTVRSATRRWL